MLRLLHMLSVPSQQMLRFFLSLLWPTVPEIEFFIAVELNVLRPELELPLNTEYCQDDNQKQVDEQRPLLLVELGIYQALVYQKFIRETAEDQAEASH